MSGGAEPTAREWLRRLEAGEVSAVELAEHQLDLLEGANAAVNAVAAVDPDLVRAEAAAADLRRAAGERPVLLGLPVTVKDNITAAGLPHRCGSLARDGRAATEDATVVARLRDAGAVVLAKTTVPEYTWSYETESALHGRTLNPLDPARTPGGSSGGEAALIALGASVLGLGSDGGGSIRVPSHYCGIAGLRPSARLVPETGCWPPTRDTGYLDMATLGPLARSVDDLALLLRLIAGGDGIDPLVGPFAVPDPRGVDVSTLRVGFYPQDGAWAATPSTEAAVRNAAAALAERGAQVEEVEPPARLAEATELFFAMMAADGGARARADLAAAGGRHVPQLAGLLESLRGLALTAEGFFDLVGRWGGFRAELQRGRADFDVVLSPVAPGPAPLHGCRPGDDLPVEAYTPWSNVMAHSVAGVPVAVVPAGTERGLPLGVHIAGRAFEDHVALAAALAVEEALGGYAGITWPLVRRLTTSDGT
jgi:Asp-tRNA(Asn)/Glu-tRNA(Gln) amidotransferase A subunit family amidase